MPLCVHGTIPTDANEPPRRFEMKPSMKDAALTHDPETGRPVRRVMHGDYLETQRWTQSPGSPKPAAASGVGSCCGLRGRGGAPDCCPSTQSLALLLASPRMKDTSRDRIPRTEPYPRRCLYWRGVAHRPPRRSDCGTTIDPNHVPAAHRNLLGAAHSDFVDGGGFGSGVALRHRVSHVVESSGPTTTSSSYGMKGSVANGALWRQFAAGNAWVEEARFSPSGEWIAGRAGRHLRVWRVEGDLALEFSGHESTLSALTWRAVAIKARS